MHRLFHRSNGTERPLHYTAIPHQLDGRDRAPPPVLIVGETGTGKELVARALHFEGSRRSGPFVEINCATLSPQLVESELFGHERGAFTDAKERRPGLIQSADHGTLFLDEIGEMLPASQSKLLKVLEDHRIRPVGSARDREVDVRFVAATNVPLEERVRSGEFREDLLYRLRTIRLAVPPLRERGEDAMLLAEHFLADHRRRYGRSELHLEACALEAIRRHSWPGNVRELRNVLEQAALLSVGVGITADDLSLWEPPPLRDQNGGGDPGGATLVDVERDLIVRALQQAGGNVTVAAQARASRATRCATAWTSTNCAETRSPDPGRFMAGRGVPRSGVRGALRGRCRRPGVRARRSRCRPGTDRSAVRADHAADPADRRHVAGFPPGGQH